MFEQSQRQPIVCNVWRSPLMHVVADGLEVRCKSCRGATHRISRTQLEQAWDELEKQNSLIPAIEKQGV
jgi:hypothetical protein